MIPFPFKEATHHFGPPAGTDESQCGTVFAWQGEVKTGSMDGTSIIVTAWKPTPEELAELVNGKPIFLTFAHGMPPHYPSMSFEQATKPI